MPGTRQGARHALATSSATKTSLTHSVTHAQDVCPCTGKHGTGKYSHTCPAPCTPDTSTPREGLLLKVRIWSVSESTRGTLCGWCPTCQPLAWPPTPPMQQRASTAAIMQCCHHPCPCPGRSQDDIMLLAAPAAALISGSCCFLSCPRGPTRPRPRMLSAGRPWGPPG